MHWYIRHGYVYVVWCFLEFKRREQARTNERLVVNYVVLSVQDICAWDILHTYVKQIALCISNLKVCKLRLTSNLISSKATEIT